MDMNKRQRGFTIIELIVIIVVIGILAAITLYGANRYQMDARDAKRTTSITVISEALEKYYDQNGEYPNCSAVGADGATVAANTLKDLNAAVLVAPQAASGVTNSLGCGTVATTANDVFQYVGDGTNPCTNSTGACLRYTLRYKSESDGTIIQLKSRRPAS